MPTLTPNYLTVDPVTGAVGADFTGHVHALGLDLDSSVLTDPAADNQVRWIRQSDGAVVASIGTDGGNPGGGTVNTELESSGTAGQVATLLLNSRAVAGGGGSSVSMLSLVSGPVSDGYTAADNYMRMVVTDDTGVIQGQIADLLLLDGYGRSEFVHGGSRDVKATIGAWGPVAIPGLAAGGTFIGTYTLANEQYRDQGLPTGMPITSIRAAGQAVQAQITVGVTWTVPTSPITASPSITVGAYNASSAAQAATQAYGIYLCFRHT